MAAPQDEHAGLSGLARDAFGLSARGQMGYAQFQLFHMPSTWRRKVGGVAEYGMKWRGAFLGKQAMGPLEGIYQGITGKSRIPVLSSLIGGTQSFPGGTSYVDLGAARKVTSLGAQPFTDAGRFQHIAGRKGEYLFRGSGGKAQYGRAIREVISGSQGEALVGRWLGGAADPAQLAAGRGLFRKAAGQTLLGGIGRVMYPVTIGMNFALVADIGITLGSAAGRAATGVINKLGAHNELDFGTGVYAASAFRASTTERQRALKAIQRNNLNARRAIGGEASLLHS